MRVGHRVSAAGQQRERHSDSRSLVLWANENEKATNPQKQERGTKRDTREQRTEHWQMKREINTANIKKEREQTKQKEQTEKGHEERRIVFFAFDLKKQREEREQERGIENKAKKRNKSTT